jgi:uncharacterized protein YndB with AHSA1/START domain
MAGKKIPTVEVQMLIRRPVNEVFRAFIDPVITTNFWFTKSSGSLEMNKTVIWEWEMYGVSTRVLTKEIIPNKKIKIEWSDPVTTVEFEFNDMHDQTTHVIIKNNGFKLEGDELIQAIKDNTGGFTTVLDGSKAYLEHNLKLNLIADKFPGKLKKS